MTTEETVAAGLIDWVNSFDLAEEAQDADDLRDGHILWSILQQIDSLGFPGSLPESREASDEWVHRWTNLKHLYDALTIFLIEECGQKLPIFSVDGRSRLDLKAIAQHSSIPDLVLLLKLCVVAAINCPARIEFLKRMQELGESTQEILMTTVQEAGEGMPSEDEEEEYMDDGLSKDITEDVSKYVPPAGLDSDLASEERLGKVIADNQRIALEKRDLQRQMDDLYTRYERLQETNNRTQEELSEANDRLTAVLSGKGESGQSKAAETKQETIIAALEARVVSAETENEELRKSNEVLKIKADRVQKLQDDYDEIKIERDKLSRKANTAEKYRQKLESIQDIEKENANLKIKVSELQMQIKGYDSSRASSSNLQREIDEYRRLLPSIEQERYDLNEMKKRLEFDYHTLEARYHDLGDQLKRSQIQVEELQGRLQDYEDGVRPSTPPSKRETTVPEEEEEQLDDQQEQVKVDDKAEEPHIAEQDKDDLAFAEIEARLTESILNNTTDNTSTGEDPGEADGISEDELRAIMSAMRAQAQAGSASERESGVRAQKKLLVALDRQRTRNVTLAEHVKKQSELISQLKDNQKPEVELEPEPKAPPPKTETPSEARVREIFETNENLKREIKLITSAWYEQNQRLATSGGGGSGTAALMLMRSKIAAGRSGNTSGGGLEEPRSFLGKQRRIAEPLVLGRNGK